MKIKLALLLKQIATVELGFLVILLLTGGRTSEFLVGLSVVLGTCFVVWSENK
ncbi:MAG: hypothetical protein RMZ43_019190 [Nostoc sp. CmiVER01]|uniref:hypothetical protein n=1 Tax=Nostoc sp. CmiVER01 TaxID=3075384 RepID=UPI002AD5498C|nr:hypothetical protein [Nostoc sp. CmiVER01]MDZ8126706.1 hypothetical protein [Nostoc sp. CmiVER01]